MSIPHSREGECYGGRAVERALGSVWEGTVPWDMRQDIQHPGEATDKPVCKPTECKTPGLLLQMISPQGISDRRHVIPVGFYGGVCLPTSSSTIISKVIRKVTQSKGRIILVAPFWPCRPWFVEILQLLMDILVILPDTPHLLLQRRGTQMYLDIKGLRLVAWKLSGLPSDRRDFWRQLQTNASRGSTMATYDSQLRRFEEWCHVRQILSAKVSVTVWNFLQTLFEKGNRWPRLNILAIAAIHKGVVDGSSLSTHIYT